MARQMYAFCCLFTIWLKYIFYLIKHCILLTHIPNQHYAYKLPHTHTHTFLTHEILPGVRKKELNGIRVRHRKIKKRTERHQSKAQKDKLYLKKNHISSILKFVQSTVHIGTFKTEYNIQRCKINTKSLQHSEKTCNK